MSGRTQHLLDDEISIVGDLLEGPLLGVATVVSDFTFDRHGKYRRGRVLARALRDAGIATYRFDAEGNGLAGRSAEWPQAPWVAMAAQICRIRTVIARQHAEDARHLLIGLGIGGVPAVQSALETPPAALVLVGSDLVQSVRFVVNGLAGVRGGEQLLPSRVFRDREQLAPRDQLAELGIPVLCVNGGRDPRFEQPGNDLSFYGAKVVEVPEVVDPLQTSASSLQTAEIIRRWAADVGAISLAP